MPEGTEAAVHKVFKDFLEKPCAQMYIALCMLPNSEHEFLPEQFRKGNHLVTLSTRLT